VKRGATLLAMAAAAACSSIDNHLLFGQQYDPAAGCLEPAQAIDDVAGSDPGSCAPACLLATEEGGSVVFITTTCGPYPPYLTQEPADAATSAGDLCKGAFAAYTRGAVCGPDAATMPEGGLDAGPEAGADAATDARLDANADAGVDAAVDAPTGG
jgi:hypothetical protein